MTGTLILKDAGDKLGALTGHKFDVIECIEPGVPSPPESLSEDHMIGIYLDAAPKKMMVRQHEFHQVDICDFLPKLEKAGENGLVADTLFLEMERMRGCRFQAADLQYLEADWTAFVDEVKYTAAEVMGCAYYIKKIFGEVFIYFNNNIPMPLWIRPVPLNINLNPELLQIAIQARSLSKPIFTNIHTEVSMEYARQWAEAARGYYKICE